MIWTAGKVVAESALSISVRDQVFEHGLGLFETLRTWNGTAPLLDRHLARLTRSAAALALPLDPARLPDAAAVAMLLKSGQADVILRITMTGGRPTDGRGSALSPATVWMSAAPLPPMLPALHVMAGPWLVVESDRLNRHKTLNYWSRRLAHEAARDAGCDEVLSLTADGCCWEGGRTNLFVINQGTLITPTLDGPIVPGVMRALVIELAHAEGIAVEDRGRLAPRDLIAADEVFLTNSVRGIMPVGRFRDRTYPALGPWTERLRRRVGDWLQQGGSSG